MKFRGCPDRQAFSVLTGFRESLVIADRLRTRLDPLPLGTVMRHQVRSSSTWQPACRRSEQ